MKEEKCCSKKCIFGKFNCVCKLCDHPWCLGGLWTHSDGFCEEMGASCDDGIQNQDETGIDCGGICPSCTAAPSNAPWGGFEGLP